MAKRVNLLLCRLVTYDQGWFTQEALEYSDNRILYFIYFDKSAADFIADYKPLGVGIDYMSVDAYDAKIPVAHHAFFSNEILIYEGLNLNFVSGGNYFFIGLPLSIENSEGSPVRALLYEESLDK